MSQIDSKQRLTKQLDFGTLATQNEEQFNMRITSKDLRPNDLNSSQSAVKENMLEQLMNEYDQNNQDQRNTAARINHKFMTVGMMNDITEQNEDEDDGAKTPKMEDRKPNRNTLIRPTLDNELVKNQSIQSKQQTKSKMETQQQQDESESEPEESSEYESGESGEESREEESEDDDDGGVQALPEQAARLSKVEMEQSYVENKYKQTQSSRIIKEQIK